MGRMSVSVGWVAFLVVTWTGVVHSEEDVLLSFDIQESPQNTVNHDVAAMEWFGTYGWNDNSNGAEAFTDRKTYEGYLRALQEQNGLPVTGKLDNATKALMSQPRCGYPDYGPGGYNAGTQPRQKRFQKIGTTWRRNTVTWYIAGTTNDLSVTQIEDAIRRAFQRWDDESGLTLMRVTNARSADIIINFNVGDHGDGNNFDGLGGTLAHAYGPADGLGGDIHFDDAERFTIGPGTDLHIVATHEIGHSLGLAHSTDNTAVMAPFYKYDANFRLRTDDINGIRALYGRPPAQPPAVPPTLPPPPPTTTTTTPAPTTPPRPNYCGGDYDAVCNNAEGGLYVFRGAEVLKLRYQNFGYELEYGYPKYIWEEFPDVYTVYVDTCVLFRYSSGYKILFIFNDNLFWRVDLTTLQPRLESGYPLSITDSWGGVPSQLDAAFFWTGNSYLYFIKGDYYYRYSFYRRGIDAGYPRPLSVWNGVETPVADAFDFRGRTYFFQEDKYQQFSDGAFRAGKQFDIASTYLGCTVLAIEEEPTDASPVTCGMDNGSSTLVNNTPYLLLLTIAFYILRQV